MCGVNSKEALSSMEQNQKTENTGYKQLERIYNWGPKTVKIWWSKCTSVTSGHYHLT